MDRNTGDPLWRLPARLMRDASLACPQCPTRHSCLVGRQPEVARRLALQRRDKKFSSGTTLSQEGQIESSMVMIKEGAALSWADTPSGLRPVRMLGAGSILGKGTLYDMPSFETVIGTGEGVLCEFPVDALRSLAERDATVRQAFEQALLGDTRDLLQWCAAIGRHGVTARLLAVLLRIAETQGSDRIRIPHQKALAELLGATRESVAKTLSALDKAGCLRKLGSQELQLHTMRMREQLALH